MYYSMHPHIHFTHPTCLLRASPACDSLAPPMSLFLFLGLCLCITGRTLTFTSRTPPAYFVHLPHVIVLHPLYLCFSFLGLCLCITRCTLTFTSRTTCVCFSFLACVLCSLLSFFLLLFFFSKKKRKQKYYKLKKIQKYRKI